MAEVSNEKFEKEMKRNRLKFYLQQFWVEPTKDNNLIHGAESFVKSKSSVQALVFRTDKQLKQYAQRVILAFNENIYWDCVNSYQLVERFIQGESIYQDNLGPQLLIITHGYNEMANKQLVPIVNQVIAMRKSQDLKTLLLSLKVENGFDPAPIPLADIATSKSKEII